MSHAYDQTLESWKVHRILTQSLLSFLRFARVSVCGLPSATKAFQHDLPRADDSHLHCHHLLLPLWYTAQATFLLTASCYSGLELVTGVETTTSSSYALKTILWSICAEY